MNENDSVFDQTATTENAPGDVTSEDVVSIVEDAQPLVGDRQTLDSIKEKRFDFRKEPKPKREKPEGGGFFIKLLALCVKIIVIMFMIPVLLFGIGTIVCFAGSLVLACQGLPLVGVTFAILGALLCTVAFSVWVFRALFNNGGETKCQE